MCWTWVLGLQQVPFSCQSEDEKRGLADFVFWKSEWPQTYLSQSLSHFHIPTFLL